MAQSKKFKEYDFEVEVFNSKIQSIGKINLPRVLVQNDRKTEAIGIILRKYRLAYSLPTKFQFQIVNEKFLGEGWV